MKQEIIKGVLIETPDKVKIDFDFIPAPLANKIARECEKDFQINTCIRAINNWYYLI